jgi:hypothetical protein
MFGYSVPFAPLRKGRNVILRCVLDGLLLQAKISPATGRLRAWDGDESFVMEAVEAIHYEAVLATAVEMLAVERAGFRLLRRAADFGCPRSSVGVP